MDTIEILQGTDKDVPFDINDSFGQPVTSFTPDTLLSCVLWSGDNEGILASPVVVWADDDPTLGRGVIQFAAADTADLPAPATYRLAVKAANGLTGRVQELVQAWLKVNPAPGIAVPPLIYGSYQDLLLSVPDLETIQGVETQAQFVEERAAATQWLLGIILSKTRAGERSWLAQCLDDGKLVVDSAVRQAIAFYALSLVLDGRDKEEAGYAARLRGRAENIVKTATVYINVDGNGNHLYPVNLSTIPFLRG